MIFMLLILVVIAHVVGRAWNKRTPRDGINESMVVDVNGSRQWINIYGQNKKNPVLLYLHGGPGASTSAVDYVFTRKWSDIYTVVTWDQRNCGKSYDASQNDFVLTKAILLEDGKQITEFLRKHLGVDKITILGHSWGSLYGANLVQMYPQYFTLFIGTGQLVDPVENEKAFKEAAAKWAESDTEAMQLVEKLKPEEMDQEYVDARNSLLTKFGYSMMKDGTDYNFLTTVLFNPHYSLTDWLVYLQEDSRGYLEFFRSDALEDFSIKDKFVYSVPYININGDMDFQANYQLAQNYYEGVIAPAKGMIIMKNTSHGLLESKSEEFSNVVHDIFEKYKRLYK
ncbi:alpha/beta hydrolase [Murdochiella sp. Marseille-P8839]|nr:alpha/beta hydrolase [Murdochiella sp. Marseille-P8839]